MTEQTPSQAEGERPEDDAPDGAAPGRDGTPRTTPSQPEGDREQAEEDGRREP
ncbi:hypothetical protein ACPF8X_33275 [Streptomyces sp. G35A]